MPHDILSLKHLLDLLLNFFSSYLYCDPTNNLLNILPIRKFLVISKRHIIFYAHPVTSWLLFGTKSALQHLFLLYSKHILLKLLTLKNHTLYSIESLIFSSFTLFASILFSLLSMWFQQMHTRDSFCFHWSLRTLSQSSGNLFSDAFKEGMSYSRWSVDYLWENRNRSCFLKDSWLVSLN